MVHCYVVSQKVEKIGEKQEEQTTKKQKKKEAETNDAAECMDVSETLGGALCLIGGMVSDLEREEPSFKYVDIQIGSGYFAADGKSYVLKLISEVPEKNLKLTHGIWPAIVSP